MLYTFSVKNIALMLPGFSTKKRRDTRRLRLLDELFLTAGAGDRDLALASGDPDPLAALGAVIVPVLPVLHPVQQLQVSAVLLIALVGVPGQAAEDRPDHQAVAEDPEAHLQHSAGQEAGQQARDHARHQDRDIQFVIAVTALHEAPRPGAQLHEEPPDHLHPDHPFRGSSFPYYIAIPADCNGGASKFIFYLIFP